MQHSQKLLYAACSIFGIVLISMIGYNIFTAHNEAYVDRHIRELKYEKEQIHKEQNSLIQKKLEEDDGQENQGHKSINGQENELSPEGRH